MTDAPATAAKKPRRFSRFMNYIAFGIIVGLFLAVLLWRHIFITIPPGSVGVHWLRFFGGTQLDTHFGEGTKIIFPWDRVYVYDTRLQRIDESVVALSADGLEIHADVNILYSVRPNDAPYLNLKVGPEYETKLVRPVVGTAVREQIAKAVSVSDLYGNASDSIETLIQNSIQAKIDSSSVELPDGHSFILVSDFNIVRLRLPDTVNQAIEAKEAAKQSLVRYKYLLQEAALEAQRREIEAGGIKRFQEIVAPTISDSFLRWRGIEATLALAQSPNSKIVVIGGSAGLPLILDGRGDTAAASPTGPATASPSPTMDQSYWNRRLDSSMLFPPTYKDAIVPQGLPAPPKSGALADPAGHDPAKTTVAKP